MKSLVIDDSAAIRKVARRLLERLDFEVVEAEDVQTGLDACGARMPDVIFVEHMPVVDGVEFVTALRSIFGGSKPKVVLCVLENDFDAITTAIRAGADDFILKPFDRESFEGKLREMELL